MHRPAAVSFPCGYSAWHAVTVFTLWLVAFATAVFGAWSSRSVADAAWLLLTSLTVGACALWALRKDPVGRLSWDGSAWLWSGPRGTSSVRVWLAMDFGGFLLLRLKGTDRWRSWLWLARSSQPAAWTSLRRAVVFGQKPLHDKGLLLEASQDGSTPGAPNP